MKKVIVIVGLAIGVLVAYLVRPQMRTTSAPREAIRTGPDRGVDVRTSENPPTTSAESSTANPSSPSDPPRFFEPPAKALQNDPRQADYDPVRLIDIGHRVSKVFSAEPRSESWAGEMETLLRTSVGRDVEHFSARARVSKVECRVSTCLVEVDAPNEELKQVALAIQLVMRGDYMEPGFAGQDVEKGWHRQTLYVALHKENRDVDSYEQEQRAWRTRALENLRKNPQAFAKWNIGEVELPAE